MDRYGNFQPVVDGRKAICPSCRRKCPEVFMSKHHLRTKKEDKDLQVYLCRDCHRFIHAIFTVKQLRDPRNGLDTLEGLMSRPEYVKAVSFIRSIPVGRKVAIHESSDTRKSHKRKIRR
jgi:hypothetical protein